MKQISTVALGLTLVLGLVSPLAAQATADRPVLVTSIGQSPGAVYFRVYLERLNYDFKFESMATVEDLTAGHESGGNFNTLILVTGASGKGMGAAGVTIEDELARAERLIAAARGAGIRIIGAHIEGKDRRAPTRGTGPSASEQSIDAVCPFADILLIRQDGDEDGRFTTISTDNNIPMVKFETLSEMSIVLTGIFGN